MRILHVSTRLILGGSQENTVLSCEGQASPPYGHDVHLAFGPIYGPEGSMLQRVQAFAAEAHDHTPRRVITTHLVKDLVRELSPVSDFDAYLELRRLIDVLRPDIVHTHSSKAGIVGRAAAWSVHRRSRRDAPLGVVHTIHGPPFHKYESKWRNRLYIASEKWAAKHCHAIVSVADAMTRQFLDAGIGTPELYSTVYSGMEVDAYVRAGEMTQTQRDTLRASLGLQPGDLVIGTVARLAELKGHDDLLESLAPDLRKHPGLKLLWVGDGWWRERLLAQVEQLGLTGHVVLTGLVPPERVPELMRAMDVMVHPSYREGLPRTAPQALLTGTPVVAYDVDGTGEVIQDFQTGRLVAPGDTSGLREAVLWMLEDEPRRRATAARGRDLCRERFDARTMVRELEAVYARALERARER